MRHSAGPNVILPYFDFHSLASFSLNDVHSDTVEVLDKPNSQYLDFWFPDDDLSPFYEMDDRFEFDDSGNRQGNAEAHVLYPPYGSSNQGDDKENYRWYFVPRGRTKNFDDFTSLQGLARFMDPDTTSNQTFDRAVFDIWDVSELLRVWAIELNIDDWDTWGGRRGKNGYLHLSSTDGKWRKIPWDIELTYGSVGAFGLPASPNSTYSNHFAEITRMINRPAVKRLYYGILAEQVDTQTGFFHSGYLSPYMQRISADGVGNTGVGSSGGYIDQRAGLIRGWIRSVTESQVDFEITTNGGNDYTATTETITLDGKAPVEAITIALLRDGDFIETPVTIRTMTDWRVSNLELVGGVNDITVVGFSSSGELVASDSIRIGSPVTFRKPEITSVNPSSAPLGGAIEITGTDFHDGLRVIFGGFVDADNIEFDESVDPATITCNVPAEGVPLGIATISVQNVDGQESEPVLFTILEEQGDATFIRGDANGDDSVNISDALTVLNFLFGGGAVVIDCDDAMDANDSGGVDISDGVRILNFLFQAGDGLPAPYPDAGVDPTEDEIGCDRM